MTFTAQRTMRTPHVGMSVQFWPCGVKDHTSPVAAVVTERGEAGSGMVKLGLLRPNGGTVTSNGEYVRHISDPWIADNLHMLRRSRGNEQRGAWDWIPGLPKPTDSTEPTALDTRHARGMARARTMFADGADLQDILRTVKLFGVTASELVAEKQRLDKEAEPAAATDD